MNITRPALFALLIVFCYFNQDSVQLCSCAPEKKKRIEQKQRCDEIFKTKASV